MSATDGPSHLAIGEVLTLLQLDFPDVTISKIRFLESQGLISPERTPSGYRKFYEDDIRRLQWVLRQQKERFLPLKVIKAKLDAGEDQDEGVQPTLFGDAEPPPPPVGNGIAPEEPIAATPAASSQVAAEEAVDSGPSDPVGEAAPSASPAGGRHPAAASLGSAEASVERGSRRSSGSDPAAWLAALQEGPRRPPRSRPVEPLVDLAADAEGDTYSEAELVEATGLDPEVIAKLVEFGLLRPRTIGGETRFDSAAVDVAGAAAVFIGKGIEVRHLRAYKLAAEREVTLFEQLTLPLLRIRNPESRRRATEELASLVQSGAALRTALLRQALGPHVQPR